MLSMPTLLPLASLMTMSAACQLQLDDLHDDAQDAINDTRAQAIELGELSVEELRDR